MGSGSLIYAGSAVIAAWGVAHALRLRQVVAGFAPLTEEQGRVLKMVWTAEALTLVFIGVLAALVAQAAAGGDRTGRLVCGACAGMLVLSAGLTRITAGRTRAMAMRLGALVKTGAAALIWLGTWR